VSQNAPPASPLLGGLPGLLPPDASGGGPAQALYVFYAPSVPVSQGGPPQATSGLYGAAVPPQQGGPPQASSALFGAAVPPQQGGPPQATSGQFGVAVPPQQGGPPQSSQIPLAGVDRVGNIQGRPTPGRAHTAPGGVGFLVDGAQYSERETLNLQTAAGTRWKVTDNPGADRVDVGLELDAEIELARIAIDATVAPTTFLVIAPTAPQLGAWSARVVFRAVSVTGLASHPTLSVGTNNPNYDDQIPATALSFTGANQVRTERVASGVNVPEAAAGGGEIRVNLSVSAVATTYDIEAIVLGRVVE